jgi:hypothetical protein
MYQSNHDRPDQDLVWGSLLSLVIFYFWLVIVGVWIFARWLVQLMRSALDYVIAE